MKVYIHGSEGKLPGAIHYMTVNPVEHLKNKEAAPAAWVDDQNRGRDFTVEFHHGTAVVPEDLGKYMVANSLAHKTRLVVAGHFGSGE